MIEDDWGFGAKTISIDTKIKAEIEEMKQNTEKKNVFNVISSAVDKKFIPEDEDFEKMSSYLFLKYFSNDPVGLMIVNELNIRNNIPKKWEYWFMRIMTGNNIRYIRYNKKEALEDPQLIENFTDYYKCNEKQALEYIAMMPEEEIEKIREKYKHGRIKGK